MADSDSRWARPALVVLARCRPEEALYSGCKRWPIEIYGPQTTDSRCGLPKTGSGCPGCSAWTAS